MSDLHWWCLLGILGLLVIWDTYALVESARSQHRVSYRLFFFVVSWFLFLALVGRVAL